MRDVPLDAIDPGVAARALRSAAAVLQRVADFLDPPASRCLPLEPVKPSFDVDERMSERRHQLFVRYY
jgi:hypothetical protein